MTAGVTPLPLVPGSHPTDISRGSALPLVLVSVPSSNTDDSVLLPRHVAEAAYQLLHLVQSLKEDGGVDVFRTLGSALGKVGRAHPAHIPPCAVCHIDVAQGRAHDPQCSSDEAARYRTTPVPQVDLHDD
jgi:hypothetical protein